MKNISIAILIMTVTVYVLVGCAKTSEMEVPITASLQCTRPEAFRMRSNPGLELGALSVNKIQASGFKYKNEPVVFNILSEASKDRLVQDYIVCLAIKRDGLSKEQAQWLRSQLLYFETKPTAEQADLWLEKHRMPGSENSSKREESFRENSVQPAREVSETKQGAEQVVLSEEAEVDKFIRLLDDPRSEVWVVYQNGMRYRTSSPRWPDYKEAVKFLRVIVDSENKGKQIVMSTVQDPFPSENLTKSDVKSAIDYAERRTTRGDYITPVNIYQSLVSWDTDWYVYRRRLSIGYRNLDLSAEAKKAQESYRALVERSLGTMDISDSILQVFIVDLN